MYGIYNYFYHRFIDFPYKRSWLFFLLMKRLFLAILSVVSIALLYGQLKPAVRQDEQRKDSIVPGNDLPHILDMMPPKLDHVAQIIQIGQGLQKRGKYEAALIWYQYALPDLVLSPTLRHEIYNDAAITYEKLGDYEMALKNYLRALALYRTSDLRKAGILTNISSVLIYVKDYEKGIEYIDRALAIYKARNDKERTAIALATKARIYTETERYTNALTLYAEASKHIDSAWRKEGTRRQQLIELNAGVNNNIADIYLKQNIPDSALSYLQKTEFDFNQLSFYIKAAILVSKGQAFGQKKQYEAAATYIEHGLSFASEAGIKEIMIQAHKALSTLYGHQRQYDKAWNHERQYVAITESQFAIQKLHQINKLENKYHLALKDKEIMTKQLKIKEQESRIRHKNVWTLALLFGLITCIVILIGLYRNYNNRKKLYQEKLSNIEKTRRIMLIEASNKGEEKERSRMAKELHDGVVSEVLAMKLNLKTVEMEFQQLRYSDDYQNILFQSEEIAKQLRQIAHNMMPLNLKELGLYASIKAFIKRINSATPQFELQQYGDLPPLKEDVEKIVLLTILELIQNIIKHSRATDALLQLNYFEDQLSITIEDNGVGIAAHQPDGVGLSGLRENISLLSGSLDIKSSEYIGTTILIEIPVSLHKKP